MTKFLRRTGRALRQAQSSRRAFSSTLRKWSTHNTYANLRKPIKSALSLNPEAYHSPAYHVEEEKNLWGKTWFAALHSQNVGSYGDTHVVDLGSQSFIIARDKDMTLRAFRNVCRHRGSKLCTTNKNRRRITCPYHRWGYRLDGSLIATPLFNDQEIDKAANSLHQVHCEEFAGVVWLNLSKETPAPVREQFGDLSDKLDDLNLGAFNVSGERKYSPNCDWKLLCENFMEWYHLNPVHPELMKFSTIEQHFVEQGQGQYCGFVTRPLTDSGGAADSTLFRPHPTSGKFFEHWQQDTGYFYHLFPNISITIYPHSVYTLMMFPNGPGKANETLTLLQHPEARLPEDNDELYAAKVNGLMNFVCTVNDEDVEICEHLQLGVRQEDYQGGVFHDKMELACYRFQNMVADKMVGVNPGIYPAEMKSYEECFPSPLAMNLGAPSVDPASTPVGELESLPQVGELQSQATVIVDQAPLLPELQHTAQ